MQTKLNRAGNVAPPASAHARGTQNLSPSAALAVLGCAVALLLAPASSYATTISWNSGFANGGIVPDGTSTGWSDSKTVSGIAGNSITGLSVTLGVSGGWNGDLYAYITDGTGFAVLLNRVGVTSTGQFGYGDSGLNVTFNDSAANGNIHMYQNVPGYAASITDGSAWAPDGRNVNPLAVTASDPSTATLSSFDGLDPNGTWTLFVADLSSGDVSAVISWGLNIDATNVGTPVPDDGGTLPLMVIACAGLAVARALQARWCKRNTGG